MGFCSSSFKFFVFLFNFIFFLAGLGIIGVGSYMAIKMGDFLDFLGTSQLAPGVGVSAYIFIGIGVIVTIIAFFGCCAACTDNVCMMYTFASIMAVILIAEVGVAIACFVFKGETDMFVKDAMVGGLENYGKGGFDGVTKGWDAIQKKFVCCGVSGADDWAGKPISGANNMTVPDTCCKIETKNCGKDAVGKGTINTNGCFTEFETFVKDNIYYVGAGGIGIALVQLVAVIAACCLGKKMRSDQSYV